MAWTQTNIGAFSLSSPDALAVDFENDVAPALGKLARFCGHTAGDIGYSVAQHCVLGAESLHGKTGSQRLAALYLLHDAHESYIGDLATPTVHALAELGGACVLQAVKALKDRLDFAIYRRAGVALPDAVEAAAIKQHDTAMMNAERRALKPACAYSWGAAIEGVPAALIEWDEPAVWSAADATSEWLLAFDRFVVGVGL